MKIKTLFKFIVPVVFYFGIVGVGYYLLSSPQIKRDEPTKVKVAVDNGFGWKFPVAKFPLTGSKDKLVAYSSIRDPGGIPQGLPVRLKIPVIGVDSTIEDALITPDGRMDVPVGSVNVAWFSLGPHPGQEGSSVIGGHFGISNGVPWVFYKLDKVKVDDKLYIVDDKNDTLAFIVRSIKSFDRNADATTVFTSQDGKAHLNLITCEGEWNQVNGTYPLRLVVFADAIPSEGGVKVNKQAAAVTIPKNTTKPTAPLANLPDASKPKVTQTPTTALIATPEQLSVTPSSIKKSPPSSQMLIQSTKSLYATPLDGIITSFLLISIVFVIFKIIRR